MTRAGTKDALGAPPVAGNTTHSTGLVGTAGEYYVAAELSLRGWLATPTIKNAPGTDVLAQYREKGILVAIQTKTASPGNQFMVNAGIEHAAQVENEWVVLVKLQKLGSRPGFFVVPHDHVAGAAYAQYRRWLATPGVGGRPHVDNPRRMLKAAEFLGYEERWDLLLRPTGDVPNLLSPDYAECLTRWGVAPGHPGVPAPE
jgi:hypothetical protein